MKVSSLSTKVMQLVSKNSDCNSEGRKLRCWVVGKGNLKSPGPPAITNGRPFSREAARSPAECYLFNRLTIKVPEIKRKKSSISVS